MNRMCRINVCDVVTCAIAKASFLIQRTDIQKRSQNLMLQCICSDDPQHSPISFLNRESKCDISICVFQQNTHMIGLPMKSYTETRENTNMVCTSH